MKKKLIMLLCAGMLLGGCGLRSVREYDVETYDKERQEESEEMEESRETNPVESEEPKPGENGEGEVKKLGSGSGRLITPVTLENEWQRAAFLADQVFAEQGGNVLVSPLSLDVALGLAAEGASGETAKEIYRYLEREDYTDWVNSYMTFAENLGAYDERNGYSFSYQLANSIWIRKGDLLNPDYQKSVREKFRAEAENLDFAGDPDGSAKEINAWCDKHTKGLIKEVLKPAMISKDLESVLVNSVYFESPWRDTWSVIRDTFQNADGRKTAQDMLRDYSLSEYFENEYCTAFSKDYYEGFQFIGILPKQEGDFEISDLDLKSLMESRSTDYDVHALAPKLNFETTADNIVDILKAEGIQKAFNSTEAEFDRLISDKELFISDIIQKCKIELDENGTKAAAVTAIMLECNGVMEIEPREVKEVFLNRPFAFLIYDSVNDKIVFAGKVVEIE
ncbi:MAG: hypothetical protein J6Z35_12010 [Lachnospiraceae bacterium]|nr:hypothetical protein [Lachnospiraceae bacterium]